MLLMTEEWQFSERWWILIQMESSSLEDLNVKPKTIKTQEKKMGEWIYNVGLRKVFLTDKKTEAMM